MKYIARLALAAAGFGMLGTASAQFVAGASAARANANAGADTVIQGNWQTITHPSPPPQADADKAPPVQRPRVRRHIGTDSGGPPN